MPRPPVDLKNRNLALLLAWMVPGLGHFYQGRIGKGILYSTCILGLFLTGMILGDWRVVLWRWHNPMANSESFYFAYPFQFWAGLAAFPAFVQATLIHYGKDVLFNGFMAIPANPNDLNGLYPRLGKFLEIGTLYTMIAGLLNILAMYDAYEGPANPDEEPPAVSKAPSQNEPVGAGATS